MELPARGATHEPELIVKIVGLIGRMSWQATERYLRIINEAAKEKLGGSHAAKLLRYGLDFQEMERVQQAGDWAMAGALLACRRRDRL